MEHLVELTDTEIEAVSGGWDVLIQRNTNFNPQGALALSFGAGAGTGGPGSTAQAGANAQNFSNTGQANVGFVI